MPVRKTVLVVGHGSRVQKSNQDFEAFVSRFQEFLPQYKIRFGYIELAEPSIKKALNEAALDSKEIIVLPLFLFSAGHVKNDLPLAVHSVRKNFPQLEFHVARPLGVDPAMVKLAAKRLEEACRNTKYPAEKTVVIMVGRGSSDPDANSDFCKLVHLFEETSDYARAVPCFIAVVRPSFEETLERVAKERPEAILVQPYLFFAGRLIQDLQTKVERFSKNYPWISVALSAPLGEDQILFDLLKERIEEAEKGSRPLPCDNCQYRVPLAGLEDKVGGLNSLLWSIRHSFTHNQAMPHSHAHSAVKKHVFVCANVDCVEQGSIGLIDSLRRIVKEEDLSKQIRVSKTSCLGYCGEGPAVVVYPDGIWYRRCEEKYAEELFKKHLIGNELVPEIVDHIMQ